MRNFILVVVLLAVVGYGAMQGSLAFKARNDLEQRVEYRLDFVEDSSLKSVAEDVVRDAEKLGIALTPANVKVLFQNTDEQTTAQRIVSGRLHTQFTNKRAVIHVQYAIHVLGIPFAQEITKSKIKQQAVTRPSQNSELNQVLDAVQ